MFFSLYSSSIFTLGSYKACLTDIDRSVYVQIPLDMGLFFKDRPQFYIEDIERQYFKNYEIVRDYIDFLVNNNFAMKSQYRPEMNYIKQDGLYIFNRPFLFESIIIDANSADELMTILRFLPSRQFTKYVQIRMFFIPDFIFLNQLGETLREKDLFNTEIVLNHNYDLELNSYYKLIKDFRFHLSQIVVMNCSLLKKDHAQIMLCKDKLVRSSQCGIISEGLFCVNIDGYLKSLKNNTCLFKKISIDTHGNIKNCPSCSQSFGNIKNTTLKQAFEHPDFKKLWSITKDQVDVCKDCEFRHMCTDCRVYIKDPENIYSQPSKCTYNPYIAKWQGEDGYVPVEECGTYSREKGFVVNHERVAELNAQIWGE